MTWHLATNRITSPHVTSQPTALLHRSLQPTTSKQVTTSPPWNGWRLVHSKKSVWASQWLVTLCTFYRQILSLTYSFFSLKLPPPHACRHAPPKGYARPNRHARPRALVPKHTPVPRQQAKQQFKLQLKQQEKLQLLQHPKQHQNDHKGPTLPPGTQLQSHRTTPSNPGPSTPTAKTTPKIEPKKQHHSKDPTLLPGTYLQKQNPKQHPKKKQRPKHSLKQHPKNSTQKKKTAPKTQPKTAPKKQHPKHSLKQHPKNSTQNTA